jgi:putative ATP-dependent endonuclease of OLD family
MKIDKIEIKNYKTLEDIVVRFDGYFSSISGQNNAGKTSIVKAITSIFKGEEESFSFFDENDEISYSGSKTQWAVGSDPIEFKYDLTISVDSDPGLHSFIKKIAEIEAMPEIAKVIVQLSLNDKQERKIEMFVNGEELEKYATGEVFRRLSSSNIANMHNSTSGHRKIYSKRGARSFHEMILSIEEKEELKKEQDRIRKKVKKFAQEHRSELSTILGKLEEKYEVELTLFEGLFRDSIPLGINLKDKGVEVPLDEWGAGTQNRTRILMSILTASRIKQQENDENRITPIILIEEPESFLHPSAQAEFGRIIRSLARELEVQIIITTHSPYMLCQERPESNILLCRKILRGKLRKTEVVEVTEEQWMEPFANILGLDDESVLPWGEVVKASKDHAVLVEGKIDEEYIAAISALNLKGFVVPESIEIIPYGGKDALKNSIMLKFVIEKFDRVFITFDLDAKGELAKTMSQLGLTEGEDYLTVGIEKDGQDCIEGLLPSRILSKVHGENTDLIMKLSSNDNKKRKSAKNELKSKLLDEFKITKNLCTDDLKEFKKLFVAINKVFK